MPAPRPDPEPVTIQLLVDSIPALIHSARPDGYLDYFNKPWLEYLGVTLDKVAGWNWTAFIHPEDLDGILAEWRASLASGEIFRYETRVRRSDGEYRWMFHRKVPLRDERGNIVKWYGSSLDIDERKGTEQALRSSEADLLEAQKLSHTGSWRHEVLTGVVTFSPEVHRIFGIKPGEDASAAEFFFGRIHPADRPAEAQNYEQAKLAKTDFESDYRIVLPDGSIKHVHNVGHPVFDESGDIREFVGTVIDTTEHKLAEKGLRESEERFRLVLESIGVQVVALTLEGEIEFVNQPVLDYFGKTTEELKGWRTMDVIHPDDIPSAIAVWKGSIEKGLPYDVDHRFRRSDGAYRWFHVCARPHHDALDSIVRWYTLLTDIDERKRAEDKIREQESELRQMLDFTPQLIGVYGAKRERLYANRTALNYLGMSLDEWRHTGFAVSAHPDDSERLETYAARAFSSGTPNELELRIRKRDGSYRWFLARFSPLRDEQGRITRWYSCGTDIEDRKQAEDRLRRENVALREEIDKASMFEEIVGASRALKTVLSRISKVAPSNSTVLISGETGTGKELVARAIHRRSDRSSRAFVSVNCAAIPRELIASELFGHEKGAFTGASHQRLGRFELANAGTLFLDEVGELPAETQIALLRVLQEHEFERVGGTRPIRTDVRVIAATNRDLQAAINAGTFRSDLYYRLNVFPIEIPALRERNEDIRMLVEYFIHRYARKMGKNFKTVEKKTLGLLESYPWPGNIRELQNVIERSVIVCDTENFSVDESWLSQQPSNGRTQGQLDLSEKLAAQEKEIIEAALRGSQGRVFGPSGAAVKLGIARSTLESKIRSLKINKNRFRAHPGN